MAIGDSGKYGWNSTIGIAKETTFGTKATTTAYMEFNSESLAQEIEELRIDSINCSRDYIKRVQTNESISGSIEAHLDVGSDAIVNIIRQAFGGTISSASITADSAAHTLDLGDMESNAPTGGSDMKSLTIQKKVGGSWFDFVGCRVNQLTIAGNIGEPIMITADIVGKTASTSSDSLTCVYSDTIPLMFNGVTIQNADNAGSLTSGTVEKFTSFELSLNNNIESGDEARELGSSVVSILPPIQRDITMTLTQRFDTTTAYDRFRNATTLAFEILMTSSQTIGAAGSSTYSAKITIPKVYHNGVIPTVDSKGIITHELPISAIKENTTTGYAMQMQINNGTLAYT
jgi:hypothetical protein